jgi:transposase
MRYGPTRPTPAQRPGRCCKPAGSRSSSAEKSDAIARRKAKGSAGGRPLDFDAKDYKKRNVVERAFNVLKNWRGLATRYDKHALIYRGGVVLGSIIMWLQA